MDAVIFGMTPRELMEAGLLSFAAFYIIRNAFASMQRNDELSDKSNSALLKLLTDVLTKFPATIDALGGVVKTLETTVTSLTAAIQSFMTGVEQKYTRLEQKVDGLQHAVDRLERLLKEQEEEILADEDSLTDI